MPTSNRRAITRKCKRCDQLTPQIDPQSCIKLDRMQALMSPHHWTRWVSFRSWSTTLLAPLTSTMSRPRRKVLALKLSHTRPRRASRVSTCWAGSARLSRVLLTWVILRHCSLTKRPASKSTTLIQNRRQSSSERTKDKIREFKHPTWRRNWIPTKRNQQDYAQRSEQAIWQTWARLKSRIKQSRNSQKKRSWHGSKGINS